MNRLSSETSEELGVLLQGAADELKHAHMELRDLARGIHPAVLTDAGLQAAVESLATRPAVPVRLTVPAQRYPASLEGAAYFVVSEALANVAKYAGANAASVVIEQRDGKLRIAVGRAELLRRLDRG